MKNKHTHTHIFVVKLQLVATTRHCLFFLDAFDTWFQTSTSGCAFFFKPGSRMLICNAWGYSCGHCQRSYHVLPTVYLGFYQWFPQSYGGAGMASRATSRRGLWSFITQRDRRVTTFRYVNIWYSGPWFICQGRTCVLWAQIFSSQPLATGYASWCFWEKSDSSSTLQWHPAMAPTCQLQSACAHHFNCSNLKQHPKAPPCSGTSGPAPERAGHCYSSNLQQRAAAPYTSTLAAPSSITLAPPAG